MFVTSLIRSIAFKSVFENVKFSLTGEKDVLIESDLGRLTEIVDIMIELMTDEGSKEIVFSILEYERAIHIAIDGGLIPGFLVEACHQKRMLIRRLNWINGSFSLKNRKILQS